MRTCDSSKTTTPKIRNSSNILCHGPEPVVSILYQDCCQERLGGPSEWSTSGQERASLENICGVCWPTSRRKPWESRKPMRLGE
ncbi:hypothetical protein PILCRDRAFT_283174 [Piloderma croceum F 1598]|uniref:Uncharacterized protein n=1 Tax=Piloderma croceum (strain F 1598) TaxID=765440 RepID=A0A0C3FTF6_PILCF|nr:hypothetical protein PILCRDRAFT_283174 [Piloderma croceum F 1598]